MLMSRVSSIYLDHASSSPLRPCAREAMAAAWDLGPGNPASTHHAGRNLRRCLEDCREKAASLLGAFPDEVLFTSGATESNNLALFGWASSQRDALVGLISSPLEHASIRQPLESLKGETRVLRWVAPSPLGQVNPQAILDTIGTLSQEKSLEKGLIALQLVNQETGSLEPVEQVGRQLASTFPQWRLHTDATQAIGKLRVNFHRLMAHSLSASAHKFGGPVGSGILLVRRGIQLAPLQRGGGQQDDRRAGTESVALAAGLVAAMEEAQSQTAEFTRKSLEMRQFLIEKLQNGCPPVLVNSPLEALPNGSLGVPQILNLSFPGIRSDTLLMALDLQKVAVSAGSACSSGSILPSSVLTSMGLDEDRVRSAVRISLGWNTRMEEVIDACDRIVQVVNRLRTSPDGH